jgi:hypothetical protein
MRKITRITNTSTHPADEVKRLVRFALDETEASGVEIHVRGANRRRSSRYSGWAYEDIPLGANVTPSARYLITLRIAEAASFTARPCRATHHGLKGYGPNVHELLRDWREALVYIAAHEARHIAQYAHKRTWGKGRGEVDA